MIILWNNQMGALWVRDDARRRLYDGLRAEQLRLRGGTCPSTSSCRDGEREGETTAGLTLTLTLTLGEIQPSTTQLALYIPTKKGYIKLGRQQNAGLMMQAKVMRRGMQLLPQPSPDGLMKIFSRSVVWRCSVNSDWRPSDGGNREHVYAIYAWRYGDYIDGEGQEWLMVKTSPGDPGTVVWCKPRDWQQMMADSKEDLTKSEPRNHPPQREQRGKQGRNYQ